MIPWLACHQRGTAAGNEARRRLNWIIYSRCDPAGYLVRLRVCAVAVNVRPARPAGRAGRIYISIYLYIYRDSASVESTRGGSLTLAPIIAASLNISLEIVRAAGLLLPPMPSQLMGGVCKYSHIAIMCTQNYTYIALCFSFTNIQYFALNAWTGRAFFLSLMFIGCGFTHHNNAI